MRACVELVYPHRSAQVNVERKINLCTARTLAGFVYSHRHALWNNSAKIKFAQ